MQMEDGPHLGLPALPKVLYHNSPDEFHFPQENDESLSVNIDARISSPST